MLPHNAAGLGGGAHDVAAQASAAWEAAVCWDDEYAIKQLTEVRAGGKPAFTTCVHCGRAAVWANLTTDIPVAPLILRLIVCRVTEEPRLWLAFSKRLTITTAALD